jgi:hypothetical protein
VHAAHEPGAVVADVGVAFGQQAQHLAVPGGLDAAQASGPQGGDRDGQGVVGVVLVRPACRQQPCPRRQGGRDVHHVLAGGHQLLGEQVAEPARGLDRPHSGLEALCPCHELVDLGATSSHLLAGHLLLAAADRDRSVAGLVRVDTDDH